MAVQVHVGRVSLLGRLCSVMHEQFSCIFGLVCLGGHAVTPGIVCLDNPSRMVFVCLSNGMRCTALAHLSLAK
jgi:hypothetical protein